MLQELSDILSDRELKRLKDEIVRIVSTRERTFRWVKVFSKLFI